MWTDVTQSFMKVPTLSYGAGDFRIYNDRVVALKLAEPKITFKSVPRNTPNQDGLMWDRVETEPWMKSTADIINHRKAVLIQGLVSGPVETSFEVDAKWAAWWASPDGRVIYIGTQWYDAHKLERPGTLGERIHKLFKSEDNGRTFVQLDWPAHWDSRRFIRFLNANEGYVIGWGPAIYRTLDGGEQWERLDTPPAAKEPGNPRAEFGALALNPQTKEMLLAFTQRAPETWLNAISQIWQLQWRNNQPEHLFSLSGVTPIAIRGNALGVWVLAYRYSEKAHYDANGHPQEAPETTKELWYWSGPGKDAVLQREFPINTDTGALYLLPSGTLVVDAVRNQRDVVFISRDAGSNWEEEEEGRAAQGVYFDETSGERYRVDGYKLSKRVIK
jgi:hypothetical protein